MLMKSRYCVLQLLSLLGLMLTAPSAHAGEAVIVETEAGISVELTGAASGKEAALPGKPAGVTESKGNPLPVTLTNPGQIARARFLSAKIQQLNREAGEAARLTGSESDQEQADKLASAAAKLKLAAGYSEEYRSVTGQAPPEPAEAPAAAPAPDNAQSQYLKQRNDREERIRNTRAMRRDSSTGSAP
jgi:hypothetical protein